MKVLKIVGVIILLSLVATTGYFFHLKNSLSPIYSGEIKLKNITEETEVYFTEYGVPHIYAKNKEEAYRTLGYIHAQDRLWQMDLLRHVGSGTLSELFGPDMVDSDKFLRTVGIKKYARESAADYLTRDHESRPYLEAYIDGINQYIENGGTTLEHTILGLDIEPFEIRNIFETLTYMAFSFSNAHITDPVLTELSNRLDSTYLQDLNIYHYPGESVLKNYDARYSKHALKTAQILQDLNVPEFIGSNSWVVSEPKTKDGKVILSNDPHIGFSSPSVWHEAHLIYPSGEYYGYHIAGAPFPLLIHTPKLATGLTMFENDDMDFYIEEIHPEDSNKYMHRGEWKEITTKEETINVKGADPVSLNIRYTVHGPIVSDILKKEPLEDIVSMYWLTSDYPNFTIEAIYGFTTASSLEDIEYSASIIHGPGLNIMYGDADGNIAWWASGKLLKRRDEQTSKTFYDGSLGLDDPDSTFSFEKNPRTVNPPWGYVHSANNQPDSIDGVVYSGYYLPDDRGERIIEILNEAENVDTDFMKDMLLDHKSMLHYQIKGILLHAIKDTDRGELLRDLLKWQGEFPKEDFRPLIFQRWVYEILELAQKDEVGEELWPMYQKTHTYKVGIEHLIKNENSKWWDDTRTKETETRDEIIRRAFEKTIKDLSSKWGEDYTQWRWGDAHRLTHNHAMGEVLSFLNVGDFPMPGANEVLNNLGYHYDSAFRQNIHFGPSTRRIIDFSNVRNNSWSILPTGQSGVYFSEYYDDQAEMFANGEFRRMIMDHETIKQSEKKLVLSPE